MVRFALHLLTAAALLVVGAGVGLLVTVWYSTWWGLGSGATATLLALYALPGGWSTRLAFAVGWVGLVGVLMKPRPEGDYLVESSLQGYLLLALAVVVLVLGIATLRRPHRPERSESPSRADAAPTLEGVTRRGAAGVREKEGGWVVVLLLGALVLLVGGGYLAAGTVADGKVPLGTRIAGVSVGGRTPAEAAHVLAHGMAPRLHGPMSVSVGHRTTRVTPTEAGISVDYAASVAAAGRARGWAPRPLWDYYTQGGSLAPVVHVDEVAMAALLHRLDASSTRAHDGGVSLAQGRVVVTQPRPGVEIDPAGAEQAILAAWSTRQDSVNLPLRAVQPDIDAGDVRRAVATFANPALSDPVTLVFARSRVTLSPRQFGSDLSLVPDHGQLVPELRQDALSRLVDLPSRDATPLDARVVMVQGRPHVVPGRRGATYRAADLATAFLAAVQASGATRTVAVAGASAPPEFSTRDATRLRVVEPVASTTVTVPAGAVADVRGAAARLTGRLLRPGEQFSLDDSAGPAGAASVPVASAVFRAAMSAGVAVADRTAPPVHLAAVPAGLDATAALGGTDLRFTDDTAYGVLVDAHVAGGATGQPARLTVTLWSTPYWDVELSTSAPHDPTAPPVSHGSGPGCTPRTGVPGYTVDVTRTLRRHGGADVVRTDVVTTTYQPVAAITCGPVASARD